MEEKEKRVSRRESVCCVCVTVCTPLSMECMDSSCLETLHRRVQQAAPIDVQ